MSKLFLLALGLMVIATIDGLSFIKETTTSKTTGKKTRFLPPCEVDSDCESTISCYYKKCFFRQPSTPVIPSTGKKVGLDQSCKTDEDCFSYMECSNDKTCQHRLAYAPPSDCTVSGCPGSGVECDSTTKSCRSLGAI